MRTLELENYGVMEMNHSEQQDKDGGGWFADAIADITHHLKCNCVSPSGSYHDAMRRSNYGGIR